MSFAKHARCMCIVPCKPNQSMMGFRVSACTASIHTGISFALVLCEIAIWKADMFHCERQLVSPPEVSHEAPNFIIVLAINVTVVIN